MYVADHIPLHHLVVLKEDFTVFPNLVLKLKAKLVIPLSAWGIIQYLFHTIILLLGSNVQVHYGLVGILYSYTVNS